MLRALIPLTLVSCIAALACGSSNPAEVVGQSDQPVVSISACPLGDVFQCTSEIGLGRVVCGCMAGACTYVQPTPYPNYAETLVQSWSMRTVNNRCPAIPAATGQWLPIGQLPGGGAGPRWIPNASGDIATMSLSCQYLLDDYAAPCCDYVWWPNGYTAAELGTSVAGLPAQDPTVLCNSNTASSIVPSLAGYECISRCQQPGAGSCGSCTEIHH